ncbi:sugar phosphate isomerase/epimerase [Arthrobacter sp. ES3-54]|nr:sugar phosphate isomerase/epimerase [Arthrobacter sp. ES3-54]
MPAPRDPAEPPRPRCDLADSPAATSQHDALHLADDIGRDKALIHLDTCCMNIEKNDLVSPPYEVGDRLGYVHTGENHRGYLGSGHLNFTAIFHATRATR